MLTLPKPIRRLIVEDLVAPGKSLDAVLVGLLGEAHTPSKDDTFADVDAKKATFPGYAPSGVVVWGDTFFSQNDEAVVLGDLKQFTAGPIVNAGTVYGYYLYRGTVLIGVEMFDEPQAITEQFDAVAVVPRFSFGQ